LLRVSVVSTGYKDVQNCNLLSRNLQLLFEQSSMANLISALLDHIIDSDFRNFGVAYIPSEQLPLMRNFHIPPSELTSIV